MKKRMIFLLLAMAAALCLLSGMAFAEGCEVFYTCADGTEAEGSFREAVDKVQAAGGGTITLLEDVTITGTSGDSDVEFTTAGEYTILGAGHSITLVSQESANIGFQLNGEGIILNLGAEDYEKTLTIMSKDDTRSIFNIRHATLNLYDGVTLGPSAASGQAGGIQAYGSSTINMYGGTIKECHDPASVTGGVLLQGNGATFNLFDGLIENCSGFQGGAVGLFGDGDTFHMSGGTIRNCTDYWYGGGAINMYSTGEVEFIMDGGTIEGCIAKDKYNYGGAIFLFSSDPDSKVALNNGTITNCTAAYGGGLFAYMGTAAIKDSFQLYDNHASAAGDDIYNNGDGAQVTLLGSVDASCALTDCGHCIDGWYLDGAAARWGCEAQPYQKYEPATVTEEAALKAAHGSDPHIPDEPGGDDGDRDVPFLPVGLMANWLNTEEHDSYLVGYADGTIRPEGKITRGEVATIFFRLLTDDARAAYWSQTNGYSDVTDDRWYNNAISTLSKIGIITGYADGTFRPNAPITRAEFVKIATGFCEMEGKSYQGTFTDVLDGKWYTPYVEAAAQVGLIYGDGGKFRPESSITRAEASAIVNRLLGRHPHKDHLLPGSRMIVWPDCGVDAWYYADVMEATNSHTYTRRRTASSVYGGESWTDRLAQPDWLALERSWSDARIAGGEAR